MSQGEAIALGAYRQARDERDEARHQRDLLQEALAKVLHKAGVIRGGCLPSGPELLVAAESYASHNEAADFPDRVVPAKLLGRAVAALREESGPGEWDALANELEVFMSRGQRS